MFDDAAEFPNRSICAKIVREKRSKILLFNDCFDFFILFLLVFVIIVMVSSLLHLFQAYEGCYSSNMDSLETVEIKLDRTFTCV